MAGKILCGTCGYDYPEWRNIFYPVGLPREEFLTYYAAKFGALEVNNTFYRMPTEYVLRSMVKRTGGKLLFSIKAPQTFSHSVHEDWKRDASLFKEALRPLVNEALLSAVLFQFPQSFHYSPDNRVYLDSLLKEFAGHPVVVEFRHKDWLADRVYEGLTKRGAGLCLCDMPALKYLPGLVPIVTGGMGYIRFHGRNAQNWYGAKGTNGSERYRYLYTEKELRESVPVLRSLAARAKLVQVFFNNHPDGGAAVNALVMQDLLG